MICTPANNSDKGGTPPWVPPPPLDMAGGCSMGWDTPPRVTPPLLDLAGGVGGNISRVFDPIFTVRKWKTLVEMGTVVHRWTNTYFIKRY